MLKDVPGIGSLLFKRLIERFGSPEQVFAAPRENLLQIDGITPRLVLSLRQAVLSEESKKDMDMAAQKGYQIVCLTDPLYPHLLREISDPPPFLYISGTLNPQESLIAVVGSRNATSYGISTTRRLCTDLVGKGLSIISGMARGIDTAAHEGALMGKGRTIAVLGSGLERIYPPENLKLFYRICEHGAVISEFPLNTTPDAHRFPMRNRIISGMSLGTLVVEATRNSGSLITARCAVEQNREVFAIPGNIHSFKSAGSHILIKQGAKLVECVQDIIDELRLDSRPSDKNVRISPKQVQITLPASLNDGEKLVVEALSLYPVHSDELVRKLDIASGKLMAILLQLEIKGVIQRSDGNYFSLKS